MAKRGRRQMQDFEKADDPFVETFEDEIGGFLSETPAEERSENFAELEPENRQEVEPVVSNENAVEVKRISKREYDLLGRKYALVQETLNPSKYHLVEAESLGDQLPLMIDASRTIQPYLWEEELEALFPDIETVRQNALKSFLLAGAFDKDAVNRRERNDMFDSAFPYRRQLLGDK